MKNKVAIPKSAAASLEAMVNYQLPGGSPGDSPGGGAIPFGAHSSAFGAIGMGQPNFSKIGDPGHSMGSMVTLKMGGMLDLGGRADRDTALARGALMIPGVPKFIF